MNPDANEFAYDVLFSYVKSDRKLVQQLAARLSDDGVSVCWNHDQSRTGATRKGIDSFALAFRSSRTLIVVLSAKALKRQWEKLHAQAVLFRDVDAQKQFLPLRTDDAAIPESIAHYAYIDWREGAEEQYERLLATTRAVRPNSTALEIPKVFVAHDSPVSDVMISSNGEIAYSASADKFIRKWDLVSGQGRGKIDVRPHLAICLVGNCSYLVMARERSELQQWDMAAGYRRATVDCKESSIENLFPSRDRQAVLAKINGSLRVWDVESSAFRLPPLETGIEEISAAAISTSRNLVLLAAKTEKIIQVWDLQSGTLTAELFGHSGQIRALAISEGGEFAASGSEDTTVRIWDLRTNQCVATFEGHVGPVHCVVMTPNGRKAVSGSIDGSVKIWETEEGTCIATIKHGNTGPVTALATTESGLIGVYGSAFGFVAHWDISASARPEHQANTASRYTNAKVLLVGGTGVGKTCLAHRLTTNEFASSTISTDGAWATHLKLPQTACSSSIEREIWLWDFAGQSDYRLIHQLFFDETSLAILVFNPQSDDPFDGLEQWDHGISRAATRSFSKLLVAGRCDRGGLVVSRKAIEQFKTQRGFAEYIETSASTGSGCEALRQAIIDHIQWTTIPWTSSPRLFKQLKDAILELKDLSVNTNTSALLRMSELRQQLQLMLPTQRFSAKELETVVALLAGPGILWRLEFGDFVLLQPQRINSYAAALIRAVRAHVDEIGVIDEDKVLRGDLDYQDMERLPSAEEQVVLRAMHYTFVNRGICLREHTDKGTVLIFPSHFRRERPELVNYPTRFVTYRFSGHFEEIYASLVAKLHYTSTFEKDQLWRFAADFRTQNGLRAGFKMTRLTEAEAAEMTVYFEPAIPEETKITFIRYIHDHLQGKAIEVSRQRHYVCTSCGSPIENRIAVQKRLARGDKDIGCPDCERRVPLFDLIEQKFASSEVKQRTRLLDNEAQRAIDNESKELILVGHAFAVAGEAGQIFRPTANSDWGIDDEIEFKDDAGNASGRRVYLQLKSGDSYLVPRRSDITEVFTIRNERHVSYWQSQAYPVMLVIRNSEGGTRWMNITEYLRSKSLGRPVRQVVFDGETFNAASLLRLRQHALTQSGVALRDV